MSNEQYEPQRLFSHDIYKEIQESKVLLGLRNEWYYGTVTERSTGQRVYKSNYYLLERDALNDVLDWIEVEEFARMEFEE